MTWNVAIVKKWVQLSSREEIASAINIPSPAGTALCIASALKKDRESGTTWFWICCHVGALFYTTNLSVTYNSVF